MVTKKYLLILTFIYSCIKAQGYSLPSDMVSQNGKYMFSSGFTDRNMTTKAYTLSEYGEFDTTELWSLKKSNDNTESKGVIANNGTVAIPFTHYYEFYNVQGKKIGTYVIPKHQEDYADHELEIIKRTSFSLNSMYYYTYSSVTDNNNQLKTTLICLTPKGKLLWERDLGNLRIAFITCSESNVFVMGENELRVFSEKGLPLLALNYEENIYPYLDYDNNSLFIFSNHTIKKCDLNNLDNSSIINVDRILYLLARESPTAQYFILSILRQLNNKEIIIDFKWLDKVKDILIGSPDLIWDQHNDMQYSIGRLAFEVYEKYKQH